MYHKVKNTLAGLGMVAVFIAGGLFFSEPVPAETAPRVPVPAVAAQDPELALAIALVRTALTVAEHEMLAAQAAERRARRGSQLRLQSGMPYYSFGAMLPRRGES